MNPLRWLLVGAAALLATALAAAWLVPAALDWNRYRGAIAAFASERLGRTVRIDGPVSLALLPQPVLTASGVSVDNGGDGTVIRTDALRLRVALGPLIAGRIDARELVLRGLEVQLPWPFPSGARLMRAPTWLSAVSARVEGGRLAIGTLAFAGIDATLGTDEVTGTAAAAGTAQFSGQRWRFTARLTQPGSDGSAGLDATLDGQGRVQGIGATLTAQIDGDGTLGGRVVARGPDLSQLLPAPAVPFKAEGRVSVAGGLAAADDLAVEIGGSPARGAVALRVAPTPRLDVALAASRLDLDGWLPTLLRGAAPDLPTGIDLSAEAAQLAGGTVRRLRGAFDLHDQVVDIREITAMLPGEASLKLAGRIGRRADARPAFVGTFALAAPAARTTLTWLEMAGFAPPAVLPDGVLRMAELAGTAQIEGGQFSLADLDGSVDGARVRGRITARSGERFGIEAALALDRLDLEPWLADAPASLSGLSARFARFDAALRLDAGQATLRGASLAPLALDATVASGRINLKSLAFVSGEMNATASGRWEPGGRIADGRIELRTRQVASVLAWLPERFVAWVRQTPGLWRGPAALLVTGSGPAGALPLAISASLGDLRLEAQPTVDRAASRWSGPVTLRHPGAPRLAEALGLAGAPSWLGDGSLAVIAQVSASPERIVAESFDVSAGGHHATGQLALELASPLRLTGRVAADTLPLPLPYLHAPEPLPLAPLLGWQAAVRLEAARLVIGGLPPLEAARAQVTLEDGVLRVDGLTAQLGGGAFEMAGSFDSRPEPPVARLDASVTGATIDAPLLEAALDVKGGVADASASLTASGHAPAALLSTLGGQMRLSVHAGLLAGLDLSRVGVAEPDDALRSALAGGVSPFDRLAIDGRVAHGVVEIADATLQAAPATARLSGHVDISAASAELRLAVRPGAVDPPEIGLRLSGPLDALRRTPELAGILRWRAEHATGQVAPAQLAPPRPDGALPAPG